MMTFISKSKALLTEFRQCERGSMTLLGLYFFFFMAIFGAFAIDVMNISMSQVHLQKAADQAAHAALYNISVMGGDPADAAVAKARAIEIVSATLPPARFGTSIEISDIKFGTYDEENRIFKADPNSTEAALAVTSFTRGRLNQLNTYLFKLIGYKSFDVTRFSVYDTTLPGCLREGFIAEGVVDIQSNNIFTNGFCLHSNTHVSMNNNNYFEGETEDSPGTIVSMADLENLDLPAGGFEKNEGLRAALRQGEMNLRILDRIDDMIALYRDPDANVSGDTPPLPDYIADKSLKATNFNTRQLLSTDLSKGVVYNITGCVGSGVQIDAEVTLEEVVIVTDCTISFKNSASGSSLKNVVILTSNTDSASISSPSNLQIGDNDGCVDGGGAVLATMGGMRFAATVQFYGSQLMAQGDIVFTANAFGDGTNLMAGGEISGTSNMDMTLCGNGSGDAFELDYFRMVI